MTEKTLDEKVAEALGWELKVYQPDMGGNHQYLVSGAKPVVYWGKDFFTKSISNCKKYIEPVLLKMAPMFFTKQLCSGIWTIKAETWEEDSPHTTNTKEYFNSSRSTEEEAYCNALLDLKRRIKNESAN